MLPATSIMPMRIKAVLHKNGAPTNIDTFFDMEKLTVHLGCSIFVAVIWTIIVICELYLEDSKMCTSIQAAHCLH